jgi:hypothetical protein
VAAAGPLAVLSRAASCDTSWISAVSGSWTDATKWDHGVPTGTENACITATGAGYTVTVTASQVANTITVGSGATLAITADQNNGAALTLSASGSSTNSGTIELTDTAATASNQEALLQIGTGATLTNNGTILSDPGPVGAGTRVINGQAASSALVNGAAGTVTINQDLQVDAGQSGTFTTSGAITIATGEKLLVDPAGAGIGGGPPVTSAGLDIEAGTITDNGTFSQGISAAGTSFSGGAALTVNGGTITGGPLIAVTGASAPLSGTGSGVNFSGSGSGTFEFVGSANASTLAGTIGANDTVLLSANNAAGSVGVTLNSNVTNDGTIKLTDSDTVANPNNNFDRILIGTGHTLTNDGTIVSDPGPGGQGARIIDGQNGDNTGTLDNASDGTITVNQNLQIDSGQAGTFTTSGTINIASGVGLLDASNGGVSGGNPVVYSPVFDITGGTITNDGTFGHGVTAAGGHDGGGVLNVTGGTITGTGGGMLVDTGTQVSFNGSGSGTFVFTGGASAAAISGTIGANDTVVLSANNAFGSMGVDINSNVTNDGTIKLTDSDTVANPNNNFDRITIGTGDTLTNHGTIVSDPGPGGQGARFIDGQNGDNTGTLNNASDGTMTVNYNLQIDAGQAGTFTTSGTINIASGAGLLDASGGGVSGGNPVVFSPVFDIKSGTITNKGTFGVGVSATGSHAGSGVVDVEGGTIVGGITVDDGGPVSFSGSGSGTYTFMGTSSAASSSFSGNIGSAQTIVLSPGAGVGGVPLIASSDVTNNGTIEFTDPDPSGTQTQTGLFRMNPPSTLTNNGTIITEPGGGGAGTYVLDGNVTNTATGTIQVNQTLQTSTAHAVASTFQTLGTVNVASGQALYVNPTGNASSFQISGGTITNHGTLDNDLGTTGFPAASGSLVVTGGTATGNPIVSGNAGVTLQGSGTGTYAVIGSNVLSGDVGAGYTLQIRGSGAGPGTGLLTAPAGFTNHGTLVLTDPDPVGSPTALSELVVSAGTLTNDGTITSDPGPGGVGTRSIQGTLTNAGTLTVDHSLAQSVGQFTNQGSVNVAGGDTLTLAGSFPQSAGVTTVAAGGDLVAPGGVSLTGGTLGGAGAVTGNVDNAADIAPSPSPATFMITGNYTQEPAGLLSAEVTPISNDQLEVSGAATVAGTLAMSNASGFTPAVGQKYTVLTGGSVTGQFATVTGSYQASYDAKDAFVTATAPPAASLTIGDASVGAPDFGSAIADFTVTLSAAQSTPVTVDYATANGTGIAGRDYVSTTGTLTFPAGQTQETIPVTVLGPTPPGPSTTFFVDLSNPSAANVGIARARATGTIVHPAPAPNGGPVDPSTGGNDGTVTITITGSGFYGTPDVRLTAPGLPDLVATSTQASADGHLLTATIDLTGAATGPRTVAITEPGTTTPQTLPKAFTIVPAVGPLISVSVAGPATSRPLARWSGELLYSNLGNIDAYGTLITVGGFPVGTQVAVSGEGLPVYADAGGTRTITLRVDHIAAGATGAVPISFTTPSGPLRGLAFLQAHLLHTSGAPSDAAAPPLSLSDTLTAMTSSEIGGTLHVGYQGGNGDVAFRFQQAVPPANGQARVSIITSGGRVLITAIVPPQPPAASYGPACGLTCASSVPLVPCGGITTTGGGSSAVAITCLPSGGALAVAPAADRARPVAHPAAAPTWTEASASTSTATYDGASRGLQLADSSGTDQYNGQIGSCSGGSPPPPNAAGYGLLDLAGGSAGSGAGSGGLVGGFVGALQPTDDLFFQWQMQQDQASTQAMSNIQNCTIQTQHSTCANLKARDLPGGPIAHAAGCNDQPQPPDPPPFPTELTPSNDPNQMVGPAGAGAKGWIRGSPRRLFTYTTLFENMPTAAAPAATVTVTDRLDPTRLDLSTLALGPVRFGSHVLTPPPGVRSWTTQVDLRPAQNDVLDIAGALDPKAHVLTWTFTTIDAATGRLDTNPAHGFLPPDNAAGAGEGSVSFTVLPVAGLATGASIANAASIVFDTNAPIATNTWINTIDNAPPTASAPRLGRSRTTVRIKRGKRVTRRRVPLVVVSLSGRDCNGKSRPGCAQGSGLAAFDVYEAAGRARFKRVVAHLPVKRVAFGCVRGRRYRFYAIAYDGAGNVERGHTKSSKPIVCR